MQEGFQVNKDRIKVLYDSQTFDIQRFGGISRYFYEIIRNMDGVDAFIALLFSKNYYLRHRDTTHYYSYFPLKFYKAFNGMFRGINYCNTRYHLMHMHVLFHPTYYNPYFLPYLNGNKFVLTVHDMIHEKFPQYFSPTDRTAANKALLVAHATRIIAISNKTKEDLIEILHVDPNKIDVIYHGYTPRPTEYHGLHLPSNYILYVGERRGYKNFDRLLDAFSTLISTHDDLKLVCAGKQLKKNEIKKIKTLGLTGRVLCQHANDLQLEQLYHEARLFIYPSLYEGFGLPILESYANDCPVVLSSASCFPEIAGDAGEYFDPTSADDMATAMAHILDDNNRSDTIVALGHKQLKRYSWKESARLTEITYRKTLGLI
jgi:glycosyltransferase involved in cell wall biosynthesis